MGNSPQKVTQHLLMAWIFFTAIWKFPPGPFWSFDVAISKGTFMLWATRQPLSIIMFMPWTKTKWDLQTSNCLGWLSFTVFYASKVWLFPWEKERWKMQALNTSPVDSNANGLHFLKTLKHFFQLSNCIFFPCGLPYKLTCNFTLCSKIIITVLSWRCTTNRKQLSLFWH